MMAHFAPRIAHAKPQSAKSKRTCQTSVADNLAKSGLANCPQRSLTPISGGACHPNGSGALVELGPASHEVLDLRWEGVKARLPCGDVGGGLAVDFGV